MQSETVEKNTQEKIEEIIKKRYGNYQPRAFRHLKCVHDAIRNIQIPYTKWQLIKSFFWFKLPPIKTINNDEAFLSFLEKLERELPIPTYKLPKSN